MLRDRLDCMHRCTKSAEIAVDPSLFGRVLAAAKTAPRTRSSAHDRRNAATARPRTRLSVNSSSICAWIVCAGSLRTTCTAKSPIRGSPSTRPAPQHPRPGPADAAVPPARTRHWRRSGLSAGRSHLGRPSSADRRTTRSAAPGRLRSPPTAPAHSPSSSSRTIRWVPSPRRSHSLTALTTDRRPSTESPRVTSSPPIAAASSARRGRTCPQGDHLPRRAGGALRAGNRSTYRAAQRPRPPRTAGPATCRPPAHPFLLRRSPTDGMHPRASLRLLPARRDPRVVMRMRAPGLRNILGESPLDTEQVLARPGEPDDGLTGVGGTVG
jgi:hypothetical protein